MAAGTARTSRSSRRTIAAPMARAWHARASPVIDRLVRRGYAHEIRCVHNRARVYHVHHRPLYFLIGEASSRYRRPVTPRVAVERLMLLDVVLAIGDVEWLTTAAEKAAYLKGLKAKATDDRPQQSTEPRTLVISWVLWIMPIC